MDEHHAFERLISLAKRELSADDVRLLARGDDVPDAPNVVVSRLPDGRHLVASFRTAPDDREALSRRLSMLASTFEGALGGPASERGRSRPPTASSLHEELRALATRARAVDAFVVDVDSPVVWGSASTRAKPRTSGENLLREVTSEEFLQRNDSSGYLPTDETDPLRDASTANLHRIAPDESSPLLAPDADLDEPEMTTRVIAHLRRLPALNELHKGRHLRHVEREGIFYLALSFSGIYVLAFVFDGPFDELRAERAAHESLPRIERLVLALPPLDPDPEPMNGVVAFRRRRK